MLSFILLSAEFFWITSHRTKTSSRPCREKLHIATMHVDELFEKPGKLNDLEWKFRIEKSWNMQNLARICQQK